VPEAVKSERLDRLFTVVDAQQRRQLDALVGTRTKVLIEGASKSQHGSPRFTGRSDRHEIVHVDVEPGSDPTGALIDVEIVEANKRSLVGRPLPGQSLTRPRPARGSALRLPVMAS
jgi:tRNA-2-methylthio-N6-dimethylallyladenosine synthase